ncbi:MAG TPA: hypothetical protein VGS20_15340 [Candidatus Acidoferrales bacterium]|nr:hypothetical protein [Candidatus Acidoferrales bacterium]
MSRRSRFLACTALFFAALVALVGSKYVFAQAQTYDEALYNGLKWRLIGPFRGGRVEAVTGLPHNDLVYYMGSVDGGVWRTTDAGAVWEPIFEHGGVGSIGAVAVADSDPNVIYVGTGEYCPRGDATYGDGMYKSADGGKTWRHIGLTDTRHIARILVDPQDPNRVFVAALGHVYGPNEERGVFRSTDGGQTWQRVLYKNDTTGAVDLIFDPANPQTLYAAMWTVQRKPWSLSSGGAGDGLYRSTDGGATWQLLGGTGWPEGLLGRIGVTISKAAPNRIYALVEAEGEKRGLYRSDDSGRSWRQVNAHHYLIQRPWYFTHVFADPSNADTVYILDLGMWRSTDSGETFSAMREPHGDNHILWIAPNNSARMILGNDGGASISNDYGKTWSSIFNQPTAQFYHVAADNRFDYRIYGAQQDNSTVGIATRTRHGGITIADFYDVGGGESGYDVPSPADPDIIFSGNKEMVTIARYNRHVEQDQDVTEWPISTYGWPAGPLKYRFQWTEPIFVSHFDPHTVYHAANVLFESTDDGVSWKAISPDLSRNDKSKQGISGGPITKDNATIEYYDLIFAAAESPLQKGLIWAGTDDGLVWVTRDDGAHWENVTPRDLPEWSRVSQIDPSPHEAGAAYLAVNRYKNDDLKPYIWKTTDYGKTWTAITTGIPTGAFVRVVREDPVRRGLLFAGTETGAYVSFNDGEQWQPLQLNLPTVSVRDMLVHGDDLVVATHGRAFWSLDDVTPLRQINQEVAGSEVYLYKPAVTYRVRRGGGLGLPGGAPEAPNPPSGAVIDYYLKSGGQDVTLDILDNQGKAIQHFAAQTGAAQPTTGGFRRIVQAHLTNREGLNRFVWNLRYPAPPALASHPGPWQGGDARRPLALPGTYAVRLTANGKTLTQPLIVKMDPEVKATGADLAKQFDLMNDINDRINDLRNAADQLHALRGRLAMLRGRAQGQELQQINSLDQKADAIEGELYQRYLQEGAPEDDLASPTLIRERLIGLEDTVDSADTPPTPQSYDVYKYLTQQLDEQIAKWNELKTNEIPALDKAVAAAGLGHIIERASAPSAVPVRAARK